MPTAGRRASAVPIAASANAGREGNHPQRPFHCRDCRKFFSVRTGTVMQSAKLGYQKWAFAIYILTANIKGTSSMKLHRDLGVTQKMAWHLGRRIRQCWREPDATFPGPVEADETYIGGKEGNKRSAKKLRAGRGTVGKTAVVGVKDRPTNQVNAAVVETTDAPTLQGFGEAHTEPAMIPATPENVARALLNTPPKKPAEWDYLRPEQEPVDGEDA